MKGKKKNNNWPILVLAGGAELFHCFLSSRGEVTNNYGISFGINGGFFLILNILFILFLVVIKEKEIGLKLILVGGIVNLGDRLIFSGVRDYWYFFGLYNNLADWLIGVGVLLFLIGLWKKSK